MKMLSSMILLYCAFSRAFGAYPYPFGGDGSPCDSSTDPPPIASYHVHVVFNGSDYDSSVAAINLHDAFVDYYIQNIDPTNSTEMDTCDFSHPYGYYPSYNKMCQFPFNASIGAFPFSRSNIFLGSNYAFFIPNDITNDFANSNSKYNYNYYLLTQAWFRQYSQNNKLSNNYNLSYIFHTNTGCENLDHTIWAMLSYDYNYPRIYKPGLYCCHNGPPPQCYCNVTRYMYDVNGNIDKQLTSNLTFDDSDNNNNNSNHNTTRLILQDDKKSSVSVTSSDEMLCLSIDYDTNELVLENCTNDHFDQTYWRETLYTDNFIQLENFGDEGLSYILFRLGFYVIRVFRARIVFLFYFLFRLFYFVLFCFWWFWLVA